MGERCDGDELGSLTRARSESCNTALERRNSLLEDADCRVSDSAVDVAELLEAKEPRAMCGVIEGERLPLLACILSNVLLLFQTYSGSINGHSTRVGRCVWRVT